MFVRAEDAAVLGWHVQQQGLCEAALRAFEAERIPRIKEVFGLTDKHAEKMKAGVCAGLLWPVVALLGVPLVSSTSTVAATCMHAC
jgi:2-polyprenyl-6-methoxyphenol hydroxylase-like FAD-dependent oxidoreductase